MFFLFFFLFVVCRACVCMYLNHMCLDSCNKNRTPTCIAHRRTIVFKCLVQQQDIAALTHDTDAFKLAVDARVTNQLVAGCTKTKAVLDDAQRK